MATNIAVIKGLGIYKVEIGEYRSNRNTAVTLYSVKDIPDDFIKLSINTEVPLPKNHFVVKNYMENAGIPEQVFKCGLFADTGKTFKLPCGNECPIWEVISIKE